MRRVLLWALAVTACGRAHEPPAASSSAANPPASTAPPTCRGDVGQVQPATGRPGEPRRPTHTFSIVARDPVTGDLGVAVQSHWFAVGDGVPWAEPGVGAVATQSFLEPEYGRRGLDGMRAGGTAPDVLAALVAEDPARDVRQVGMVDAAGHAAAHTGASCIAFAGQQIGDGYTVQANIMANDRVVPAMAKAYEQTKGDLADRLLAALTAAQEAGGDIRGCQSAAIRIVRGKASDKPTHDVLVDLRVDDAVDPIGELKRLVALSRIYDHMNAGDLAMEKGDLPGARREYGLAAEAAPDDPEVRFWQAVTMATTGEVDASLPIFRKVFSADRRWVEVTRRLQPAAVPATPEGDRLIERILEAAP